MVVFTDFAEQVPDGSGSGRHRDGRLHPGRDRRPLARGDLRRPRRRAVRARREERLPLRTLGRAAALVASVEQATRERERASQLDQRIALTRELHEQVIQRLFALSLVLGAEGGLAERIAPAPTTSCAPCSASSAGALERGLAPPERETKLRLRGMLGRLADEDDRVRVSWQDGVRVPSRLEPLVQSVLAEALRNIGKHSDPEVIAVEVGEESGALSLEVVNDGARQTPNGAGLGLRLAAIEALRHQGVVEFGPIADERWRVRLVCPLSENDADG